eukprot:4460200-Heterocapsa_arctica.AAC.1
MEVLQVDQEGGIMSDVFSVFCSKAGVDLRIMGKEDHSGQGLVERHIRLIENTYYQLNDAAKKDGNAFIRLAFASFDELVSLANSAKNEHLEYGGFTPMQCAFGRQP